MAAGGGGVCHDDASGDLYGVLGVKKECSDADLRLAYRKLAMTWHPDRCSASGSSASVEEAKERFQEIQGAYSVLSDSGKRLLYDVGVYDSDDDNSHDEQDVSGMGDFLGEMAEMMSQATPTESFEELQQLFVDMFQGDLLSGFGFGFGGPPPTVHRAQAQRRPCPSGSSFAPAPPSRNVGNKRCFPSGMGSGTPATPGRSGSGPGLSGLSSKGSDSRRREEAPWTHEDTSTGDMNKKKQRLSTMQSHGVSSSSSS